MPLVTILWWLLYLLIGAIVGTILLLPIILVIWLIRFWLVRKKGKKYLEDLKGGKDKHGIQEKENNSDGRIPRDRSEGQQRDDRGGDTERERIKKHIRGAGLSTSLLHQTDMGGASRDSGSSKKTWASFE